MTDSKHPKDILLGLDKTPEEMQAETESLYIQGLTQLLSEMRLMMAGTHSFPSIVFLPTKALEYEDIFELDLALTQLMKRLCKEAKLSGEQVKSMSFVKHLYTEEYSTFSGNDGTWGYSFTRTGKDPRDKRSYKRKNKKEKQND